jgi:dipeptidyl aminopeptidase/acylaminoacyl peptidase
MMESMLLQALVLSAISQVTDSMHTQPSLIAAWQSRTARYGANFDPVRRQWLITQDSDQGPTVYRAAALTEQPVPMRVTYSAASHGLGHVTCAQNGDAYGVSYVMGERQPYATIVRLFVSNETITVGEPVDVLQGQWYSSSPTISPDGSRMIFATDRTGGRGGTDLWFIERQVDGTWSAPQGCGDAINSSRQERTPQFLSNDTLLFSSDGFGGQGGMDVYMSVFRNGTWQDPVPLEHVNTAMDETDASVSEDGSIVFIRNRADRSGPFQFFVVPRSTADPANE